MLTTDWSLEAKLLAVIGCAIVIAISLVIVVCLIIPDNWWKFSTGDHHQVADSIHLKDFHSIQSENTIHTISDHPEDRSNHPNIAGWTAKAELSRSELCYDSSGFSLDSGRPGSSSSISETGLSTSSSRSGSLSTLPSTTDETIRPQIHLTLQSTLVQSDSTDPQCLDQLLIVTIENATDLPGRSYMESVDPSVSIRLERRHVRLASLMGALIGGSGRRNRRQSILAEDSTCPVVYHSRHPRFHHPVTLALPKSTELKDCQLFIKVDDKDRLVGPTELGQCRIDLRELDLLAGWLEGNESIVRLSRFLDPVKPEEKGAILLGLSFLPTSQRITVHITQCNRLIKADHSGSTIQAVIRLFVLNESGRVLKKRKTAPFDYQSRVEFNQLFHLDVEIERWDRSSILVVLSRILQSQEPGRHPPVYQHSGHVALGKRVTGQAERIHWNSSFQNPRRVISQWHSLH